MASEHPFQILFETLGRLPSAHADAVNRQAYEILCEVLSVPVEKAGRCILLRAPRAGHGKTHLLSRVQYHLAASHEFIPLHAALGSRIDAASVTDDTLRRLLRPLPASGGLTVLDLVTRRLFAMALQPLVGSGEVPCQDREGALTALRMRPIETFDFHHPNAVTAHWARENFEILGQRLSMEIAQRSGLPVRGVVFWVDILFRFAATPLDNPARLRTLADAIHEGNPGEGVQMERLETLLGMLALLMRVVLVADDLEGFSSDESAALSLAAFLGSLRHSVERLDVILSLNQDIWDSAFLPRLSGGLADRLSEVVIELGPLSEAEIIALLESRVPGLGVRVLERLNRVTAGSHARGLIRAAGEAWLRAASGESAVNPPSQPVVAAPLVVPPVFVAEMVKQTADPVPSEAAPAEISPEMTTPEPVAFQAVEETPVISEEVQPAVVPEPVSEEVTAEEITENTPQSWPLPDFVPAGQEENSSSVEIEEPVVASWDSETPAAPYFPEPEAFTPSPQVSEAFTPAPPEVVFTEAPVFTAAPVFQAAPEPVEPPVSAPEPPAFEAPAVEAPAQPKVPDTDRVDDLLRQFRERYGRGSM